MGERPVEELEVGDKVVTRDHGIQVVRRIHRKALDHGQLADNTHLRPVLITRCSLGNDLPERDMLVSPNCRMLVAKDHTMLHFEEHEVLVSAKHLSNSHSIRTVQTLGVTYIHVMFDRHEVVLANGCWAECFQPGDQSLNGLGNAQRSEIFELFPSLADEARDAATKSVKRTLKRNEVQIPRY